VAVAAAPMNGGIALTHSIEIIEVSAREGIQNEPALLNTQTKLKRACRR
jgi:hypothetical protein